MLIRIGLPWLIAVGGGFLGFLHLRGALDIDQGRMNWFAVLFLSSVVGCSLGIGLAAEMLRHERRMLDARERAWSNSFGHAVLPSRLPAVAGCRFDAVYQPGESDARIGGDWYDAVRLIDGRILLSIGDVAGSGLDAAVVMGIVRQTMRGIAQVHPNPALMLDAADRALSLERSDVYVTAWVGIVDLVGRTLTYASAGHPPALLGSADGTLRDLSSETALPLGLRGGTAASATTTTLEDGHTLLLYTDGLSEATRDVIAGDALVRAAASRVAVSPWREPAAEVHEFVLSSPPVDDVAILVARIDVGEMERFVRRLSFDVADAAAARAARTVFLEILAERGFGPIESINAELVFGELIGNVVRHAQPSGAEIAIDCSGPQTILHVFDRGPGFRHSRRLPSDIFAECGRGLFLIDAMTQEFSVEERPGGGSHARAVLAGRSKRPLICDAAAMPAALAPG